jgi:hypothetical protein
MEVPNSIVLIKVHYCFGDGPMLGVVEDVSPNNVYWIAYQAAYLPSYSS